MKETQPLFSIIIPTYNRPQKLVSCLDSFLNLDYPRDRFEVIVVDDGSEQSPELIIISLNGLLDIKLIRQTNAGPASARNRGAQAARGKFLVFTDDDCMPAHDWLSQLAARLAICPDSLVGGKTVNALPNNLYSTASQKLIDYLYDYYNSKDNKPSFFASNNIAVPTERFLALNGFDTSFPLAAAEDRDFCDRWLEHNYALVYAPEVLVYHAHHLALFSFWRQHFNYGRGAFCFHQLRSQRQAKQIEVEPLSFYLDLLTYPFSQSATQPRILISTLFFISQVANVAGFFWEKLTQKISSKN